MAVMGTFSQFTTARLAIYASQASLSVTGNNISNINTPGYTRQRMDLVSLYSSGAGKYANIFDTNVGYGVLTNGATQLRDPYLDIRFRNENTKLAANNAKLDGLHQLSTILDEVGRGAGDLEGFGVIEAQFGLFLEMLDKGELTNYGSQEYDDLVRSVASTLTSYFRKAAADLEDIKVNTVNQLNDSIKTVNGLLNQIRDLNEQIRTQSIYGNKALELRDARNLAIDELSSYLPIDVTYSMERIDQFTEVEKLTITIKNSKGPDGNPIRLVDGIFGAQLTMPEKIPESNEQYNYESYKKAINDIMSSFWDADAGTNGDVDWSSDVWDHCPEDPDPDAKIPDLDALKKAVTEAMDKAEQKVRDAMDAMDEADRPDPDAIDAAVTAARKKAAEELLGPAADKVVEAMQGKYVLSKDADGNPTAYTNDYNKAAEENGTFNYDENNMTKDGSLYMLRLEQLVDRRGRVMDDYNDPSGKSQAIALEDTAFCTKTKDATADASRIDSNALGSLQALRELLTRKGEYSTQDDIDGDPYATIKRGIPYYEQALNSLARKFAEVFNEANQISLDIVYGFSNPQPGVSDMALGEEIKGADGETLMWNGIALTWDMVIEAVVDKDGNKVLDENGNEIYQFKTSVPADTDPTAHPANNTELKSMITQVQQYAAKAPGYSYYQGGVLFSNSGDNNDPTNITAANISVSYSWSNHAVRLLNTTQKMKVDGNGVEESHSTLRDNIAHMIGLFDTKWDFDAGDVYPAAAAAGKLPVFHGTFREVFTSISATLGEDYNATAGKVENYSISTLSLDNDRLSVSGVDLNEEATSMMQFSKSYSAACRLLTTIDSMLDTLINGTAR